VDESEDMSGYKNLIHANEYCKSKNIDIQEQVEELDDLMKHGQEKSNVSGAKFCSVCKRLHRPEYMLPSANFATQKLPDTPLRECIPCRMASFDP
jgi:hypothetical protein